MVEEGSATRASRRVGFGFIRRPRGGASNPALGTALPKIMAIEGWHMEPSLAGIPDDLRGLRLALLRRAAAAYLERADPAGVIPEVVRRRLDWPAGSPTDQLLCGPPFERAAKPPGRQTPIYALRLGNHRYPHMKLQIQPWPNDAGFLLSVNTHDQVAGVNLGATDAQAFREIQTENQCLKEAIEQAWDEAGLPTFLRYLRDYIDNRRGESSTHASKSRPDAGPDAPASPRP